MTTKRAFTLLELMMAIAIFSVLMTIIFSMINGTGTIWKSTTAKIESFQGSRAAFDTMIRKIRQATLNTRYDYFDANGKSASDSGYNGTPTSYGRQSELQFVIGKQLLSGQQITHAIFFQAPLGQASASYATLSSLLNGCGYYVRYGSDADDSSLSSRPAFITDAMSPPRYRYQLMEFSQEAESLKIYDPAYSGNAWFTTPLLSPSAGTRPAARILAENVVALVLLPRVPEWEGNATYLTGDYEYDSRKPWNGGNKPMNQICPLLQVVLVVLDNNSVQHFPVNGSTPPDLGYDTSSVFQNTARLEDDLNTVETALRGKRINYRVFRTEIALSREQWTQN